MQSEWIIATHHAHFLFFYDFGVTTQSYIHSQLSFLPEIWIQYLLSFEESYVENWGEEIHELKHKYFEGQVVFILSLCSMHLWNIRQKVDIT